MLDKRRGAQWVKKARAFATEFGKRCLINLWVCVTDDEWFIEYYNFFVYVTCLYLFVRYSNEKFYINKWKYTCEAFAIITRFIYIYCAKSGMQKKRFSSENWEYGFNNTVHDRAGNWLFEKFRCSSIKRTLAISAWKNSRRFAGFAIEIVLWIRWNIIKYNNLIRHVWNEQSNESLGCAILGLSAINEGDWPIWLRLLNFDD